MSHKLPQTLPVKTISQAIDEAKSLIDIERSEQVTGLYCRWKFLNRFMMKYWRFGSVTMIGGTSGSGKSAILNMLEDDFTNPEMNPFFHYIGGKLQSTMIIVAFKYEMDAADEVLRNLSGKVKKSYAHLLSGEINKEETKNQGKDIYNKVSDEDYKKYTSQLDKLRNRSIVYIESAGNLEQLYNTCLLIKSNNPDKKLVVTLDHTLLSQKLSEKDDLELSSATAHVAIKLRKTLKAMVIFLTQLNGEIEKVIRRDNPALHFPIKTDIHCGNQVYWACDNVMIFHRPELLNLEKYGNKPYALNPQGLIHCAAIKSRKNKISNIFFENQFSEGNMIEILPETKRWKSVMTNFQL